MRVRAEAAGEPEAAAVAPERAPAGPAPAGPTPLPWPVGVALAVAAGLGLLLAFPPYDGWALAPLGVAALAAAVHRRRLLPAAGLGLLTGLVLFVPVLSWTNLHTGYLPWLLLSVAQAAYLGLL